MIQQFTLIYNIGNLLRYVKNAKTPDGSRKMIFDRLESILKGLRQGGEAKSRKGWLLLVRDICLYVSHHQKHAK